MARPFPPPLSTAQQPEARPTERAPAGPRAALKRWYRQARDRRTRRRLAGAGGGPPRAVFASTWEMPNPTHTFVYQEMLGLLGTGFDARVFCGVRRGSGPLRERFGALLDRAVVVETVREIGERDLAWLRAHHGAALDAFVDKVAAASGRTPGDLLADPLLLRACTFARLCALFRADYLHSYFCYDLSFMAMFAAAVLGVPRGLTCYADHVLQDFALKLVPLHLETADLVVATSRRARDELLALGGATCEPKILVKPNGVDGAVLRGGTRAPAPTFTLASVCRLEPKKGLLDLVDAVAALRTEGRKLRVHVIGGEDPGRERGYADTLRARIAEHGVGDAFVLHGFRPLPRILELLGESHAFVAPYVETESGDKDGIPTALLEAMGTGLPVVATDAGAIAEAVTDGREGLLVPQSDPTALAAAIARLMDGGELRERLGRGAAARFAAEFDARVADRVLHARVRALLRGA